MRSHSAQETLKPQQDSTNITATRAQQNGTKLVSDAMEDLPDGGYRRIRTYERTDGRTFTKTEELTLTGRGAKRSVSQQNPSGSVTRYEEILDREDSGTFRRTQRFQDASGEVSTSITQGYRVTDPFILTGGGSFPRHAPEAGFAPFRGTQLDLSA